MANYFKDFKMNRRSLLLAGTFFTLLFLEISVWAEQSEGIDPDRVKEIATMLSEKPICLGRSINDRAAWEKLAETRSARVILAKAEKWLETPIYEMSDEIYLDYKRSAGKRRKWGDYRTQSKGRFIDLVLAECIENKGRFLDDIEETIRVICSAKTWMMPAHDLDLVCFYGKVKKIDLNVAHLSRELAACDCLLGEKLSPAIRKLIRTEIKERTFDTFHDVIDGKIPELNWFLKVTNNWAAVCYGGILAASQMLIESREERAFFVAAVEYYIQNYVKGFTDEGHCWEGLSYWNYGFSNFIILSETMYQATGGKIDLLDDEKIQKMAMFGARMEIQPGVYPALADCGFNVRPGSTVMNFVSKRYGLELEQWEKDESSFLGNSLCSTAVFAFPNSSNQVDTMGNKQAKIGIREWYKEAGMLICRPTESKRDSIAIAIKGGCNGMSHNHNDSGSFMVVKGKEMLLVDPGTEVYTLRTISAGRFESKVINSYGHSVPVVAGRLQREGKDARAKVIDTEFTDQQDKLVFDISSAYDVKELKKLKRTFYYSREGTCSLTVVDEVSFSELKSFGTALITYGEIRWDGDGSLVVSGGEEMVKVNITVKGGEFEIVFDTIVEDMNNGGRGYPKRIGINLKEPVKEAMIKTEILPFLKGSL